MSEENEGNRRLLDEKTENFVFCVRYNESNGKEAVMVNSEQDTVGGVSTSTLDLNQRIHLKRRFTNI